MDASIAPCQALTELVKIRKGRLYKRDFSIGAQRRHLVGVASRNDDIVALFKQRLDYIVSNESCTARNEYTHANILTFGL